MAKAKTTRQAPRKRTTRSKAAAQQPSFFSFSPSIQSVYWIIIGLFVIALALWVMQLNAKVQRIYDQIDQNQTLVLPEQPTKQKKD